MAVEVKICGLTRAGDAAFAATHGAARLGVVFASGPRVVTPQQAREIVVAAASVPVLGVFGSQPLGTMLDMVEAAGLSGVQLHGPQDAATVASLRARGLEVWRVVAIASTAQLDRELLVARDAHALLVEARVRGGSGGKGIPIALDLARAARLASPPVRFVLAGGLTPDSVSQAIKVVQPDMVDVSSGIESSPGIKDRTRLARFLENVFAASSAP